MKLIHYLLPLLALLLWVGVASATPWGDSTGSHALTPATNAYVSPGYSGNSMTLNGTMNGVANITGAVDIRPNCASGFSVGVWAKKDSGSGSEWIFDERSTNATHTLLLAQQVTDMLRAQTGGAVAGTGSGFAQPNVWYHLAGTWNCATANVTMYVNGSWVASDLTATWAANAGETSTFGNGGPVVGYDFANPGTRNFIGQLDNLTICNCTWTPTQVANFYTGTPPPSNASFYFEEITGGGGSPSSACVDHTINVAQQRHLIYQSTDTFPSCYGFNLIDPPYNSSTGKLDEVVLNTKQIMGNYTGNFFLGFTPHEKGLVSHIYRLSNATTTVTIQVDTSLLVDPVTTNLKQTQFVYVDGGLIWVDQSRVGLGQHTWQPSSMVGWAASNISAYQPASSRYLDGIVNDTTNREVATSFPGGTLFYMPPTDAVAVFDSTLSGNASTEFNASLKDPTFFYLGNMSGVSTVDVTTVYPFSNQIAEDLQIDYVFLTTTGRASYVANNTADACPGLKSLIQVFLGFCPTIENMASYIGGKTANLIGGFLGAIIGGNQLSEGLATISGMIIQTYLYGLFLILLDPIRLYLVILGHIIMLGLFFGGLQRDWSLPLRVIGKAHRILGKFVIYYILATYYMLKFAWETLSSLFQTIATWVRG